MWPACTSPAYTNPVSVSPFVACCQTQDEFYNNVMLMLADYVLVVINDVSNSDISLLNKVVRARKLDEENRSRAHGQHSVKNLPVFVIHNLRDVNTFDELAVKWLVRSRFCTTTHHSTCWHKLLALA